MDDDLRAWLDSTAQPPRLHASFDDWDKQRLDQLRRRHWLELVVAVFCGVALGLVAALVAAALVGR